MTNSFGLFAPAGNLKKILRLVYSGSMHGQEFQCSYAELSSNWPAEPKVVRLMSYSSYLLLRP